MLLSISLIIFCGLLFAKIASMLKLPRLVGMVIAGIMIGPHALGFIDPSILGISTELRRIALIVILIRAGLKLDLNDLRKVGRPALLMCFVPATCEILAFVWIAPPLFGISRLDAAIMGAVVAAVSPAVVVPAMIKLIDERRGVAHSIPQMILAAASVDDVYVIVIFSTLTALASGKQASLYSFLSVPLSVCSGVLVGFVLGRILAMLWQRMQVHDVVKTIVILATASLLSAIETSYPALPFASLIAIMAMAAGIRSGSIQEATTQSMSYDAIWKLAEIFLFVLVGASVAIESAMSAGLKVLAMLLMALAVRMLGVWLCLLNTRLDRKERLFCMIAYSPKATVQAAIGGLPLAMGLACGQIVLTVSVIAILLTAPIGAIGIEATYRQLLAKD